MNETFKTKRLTLVSDCDTVTTLTDNESNITTEIGPDLISTILTDFRRFCYTDQGEATLESRYAPLVADVIDDGYEDYEADEDLSDLSRLSVW